MLLPGAKINDRGEIYVHGEKIDYLTLNGNDFFKGKNKVILENLPYFTIKDLKVYHKDKPLVQQNGIEREKTVHSCLFNNSLTYKVMDTNTLLLTR